jgi:cell division septum initiation protein DivIVA
MHGVISITNRVETRVREPDLEEYGFCNNPDIQRAHWRTVNATTSGGHMLSFEGTDETVTPTVAEDGYARVDDVDTEQTDPIMVQESSTSAAARMLELAAVTADRLVVNAETEAESLVTAARASADAILESSRAEAHRVAAELARSKEQQTAEHDRERATALAGLADAKAALEARNAPLRQMQSDHRRQMRDHLTKQLSLLDATVPETPAAVDG